MKYAEVMMQWLKDEGYTHCFFLPGGGNMHLVDAASKQFKMVPVLHELSAVIAVEYFNVTADSCQKAFCLLTTGPGVTNAVTGIAGAWLESREVLILAGQVKTSDLKHESKIRQNGIQELDNAELMRSITKISLRIEKIIHKEEFINLLRLSGSSRKGPVLIEICLDTSSSSYPESNEILEKVNSNFRNLGTNLVAESKLLATFQDIHQSSRPLLLVGGGLSNPISRKKLEILERHRIPIATTWNGVDRISSCANLWAGRPNTFGMRWSNIFQQQATLLIAVGTRLNLQQTGFNYKEFMPIGKIVHIDIDSAELEKPNPKNRDTFNIDANSFLDSLCEYLDKLPYSGEREQWIDFLNFVKGKKMEMDPYHYSNGANDYVNPYKLIHDISKLSLSSDIIVPCSSGGIFTAVHQVFENLEGQKFISNKGLASMGYGLAGSIGASLANPESRVFLFEGDGGFVQNLQELGSVNIQNLNIKIFIFNNDGYASIKTTQRNYFDGNFYGCDLASGLKLPRWDLISKSFGINHISISSNILENSIIENLETKGPCLFEVRVDPEFNFLPKVQSKILDDGSMVSNPIHEMYPPLHPELASSAFRFFTQK